MRFKSVSPFFSTFWLETLLMSLSGCGLLLYFLPVTPGTMLTHEDREHRAVVRFVAGEKEIQKYDQQGHRYSPRCMKSTHAASSVAIKEIAGSSESARALRLQTQAQSQPQSQDLHCGQ